MKLEEKYKIIAVQIELKKRQIRSWKNNLLFELRNKTNQDPETLDFRVRVELEVGSEKKKT